MRLGFVYTRIREDEKLLLNALRERGHEVVKIDAARMAFGLEGPHPPEAFDGIELAYNRCLESSRVRYVSRFLTHYDVPVVNGREPTWVCADKVRGSLALQKAGVPTPRTEIAFSVEAFEVTGEVRHLVEEASTAVGGGLLGVDLMETDTGYTVHEVNATCEFKALNAATPEVDVPGRIVDWLEASAATT